MSLEQSAAEAAAASQAPVLSPEGIADLEPLNQTIPIEGGLEMFVQTWPVPAGTTRKAVFVYNHGFAENTKLYEEFLPHFALAGFETIMYDQRGVGQTSPGKLYALTNEKYVFEDLDQVLSVVFERYPEDLVFLWGHSMGGAITLNYAIHGTYREKLAGYLAFAPMVQVHPKTMPPAPLRLAMPVIASVIPNFRKKAPVDVKYLTHDERWQKRFRSDENTRVVSSASQMNDAFKRGKMLMDPAYVAQFAHKPVAVFHSTLDQVNDFNCTLTFFELLPDSVPLKKFYRYTDCLHSLPHETPDRVYRIYNDVISFLDNAIPLSKTSNQVSDKQAIPSETAAANATSSPAVATPSVTAPATTTA